MPTSYNVRCKFDFTAIWIRLLMPSPLQRYSRDLKGHSYFAIAEICHTDKRLKSVAGVVRVG